MDEKQKDRSRSLVGRAVDTALVPFQAAVSKPAQRAYLRTAFFTATSISLLCVASAAYWVFYFSFIPQVGIDRVIHLQFGDGNPFGTTTLSSSLTSQQAYDVTLFLHLPLTPSNLATGNFMVDVALYGPTTSKLPSSIPPYLSTLNTSSSPLARSRRPAILTYTSTLVTTAHTLTSLPWYVLGWAKESETLHIPMFEGVEFAKGPSNIPDSVTITIEPNPEAKMQFYAAGIQIVARFGGLRWMLYHHKYLSFFVFTIMFWSSSMLSMVLVWLGLSLYLSPPPSSATGGTTTTTTTTPKTEGANGTIKAEPIESDDALFDPTSLEDLSDTSRTYPTLGRGQAPLHFSSRQLRETDQGKKNEEADTEMKKAFKQEADESGWLASPADALPSWAAGPGAEADDEDEGVASEWRDSGIGTSREEERREEIRRRKKLWLGSGSGR